jgi:hypothetical protein
MPQATGSNAQIIFDVESVFGTTPSPDAKRFYFLTDTLAQKRALQQSNVMRGSRNLTKSVRKNKEVSGSITSELNPYMSTFLKHLLGTNTTTGANPYTHTMKAGALPVSLCIEKGFTDLGQYFLYNGVRINKGTFEFGSDGIIPVSFDFMGQKCTIAGTSFDATPTDLGHLPFDGFEASIKEGGSTIAYVSKCTFDISNDLDGDMYVIGGLGLRRAIPEGKTIVTGRLTALFESITLYNKAVNFTESSIEVTLTRGDGLGSAGNESLVIKIPEIMFEENDPIISGPKGIVTEMPFTAFYDNAAEATSIQMILKNTTATI